MMPFYFSKRSRHLDLTTGVLFVRMLGRERTNLEWPAAGYHAKQLDLE
jgi:hypothetical protein